MAAPQAGGMAVLSSDACQICERCTEPDQLAVCDGCEKCFHISCLKPPLQVVPGIGETWFCDACMSKAKTHVSHTTEACTEAAGEVFTARNAAVALESLRAFFKSADEDENGALDKTELVQVVNLFYLQENVCRPLKLVQKEVDAAMQRFDANGDGVLQFPEFVDMVVLSDNFRFQMPLSVRLEMRALQQREQLLAVRNDIMEERESMLEDATREGVRQAQQNDILVEALTQRLDDKVLQVRGLEADRFDIQEQLNASEARVNEALAEVARLSAWQKNKLEEEYAAIVRPMPTPNSLRARTNSSPSPPPDFGDLGSLSPSGEPRTPRQGELRRKRTELKAELTSIVAMLDESCLE